MGTSAWFDLPVRDVADAMSFYEGLFGWRYRQMDESPLSDYVMIEADGRLIGGLRKVTEPPSAGAAPMVYFTVNELAAGVARAKELGAQPVGSVVDLKKGRGGYQWIRDREGNLIGLWAPD